MGILGYINTLFCNVMAPRGLNSDDRQLLYGPTHRNPSAYRNKLNDPSNVPLDRESKLFLQSFSAAISKVMGANVSSKERDGFFMKMRPVLDFIRQLHYFSPQHSFFGNRAETKSDKRESLIVKFATDFVNFAAGIEKDIAEMALDVQHQPQNKHSFSIGWEDRVRNAAHLGFVAHYGQLRKSEYDEHGEPLQYIEHPRRAAFDVHKDKIGLLTEETFIAILLHDVLEDIEKGALVKMAGYSPEMAKKIVEKFVSGRYVQLKGPTRVSILKILRFLDKHHAGKALEREPNNRTEILMCLLNDLAQMPEDEFLAYAPHIIIAKLSDRADNDRTIEKLNAKRFAAIWLETSFVYLWLAHALGMKNCEEWLLDLLQQVQSHTRKDRESSLRSHRETYQLPEKFSESIYAEIMKAGFRKGDLIIDFRPRGIRYLDESSVKEDDLIRSEDPEDVGIAFNHFVNFIPTCIHPEEARRLKETLRGILEKQFPRDVSGIFDEQNTAFGSGYRYATDLPEHAVSVQDLRPEDGQKFGYVVTRIFENKSDFVRENMGSLHAATILMDSQAIKRVRILRRSLQTIAGAPLAMLKTVDAYAPDQDKAGGVAAQRRRTSLKSARALTHTQPQRPFTSEETKVLRTAIYANFYTLFGGKKNVSIVNEGVSDSTHHSSFGPMNTSVVATLLSHDPQALVSRPQFAAVDLGVINHSKMPHDTLWDPGDFEGASVEDLLRDSPFSTTVADTATLRYKCDPNIPDSRLGEACVQSLEAEMMRVLMNVMQQGHVRGEVPGRVIETGMDYEK
jgi:hypothetical protein